MTQVLIIGGQGRIGQQVAVDLATYTTAEITITGRTQTRRSPSFTFVPLVLEDRAAITATVRSLRTHSSTKNLVIHCAGPFHQRDTAVVEACIDTGVNYIDVSDHPSYTRKVLALSDLARTAGITAIINTGIFPGISNSLVKRDVEKLDRAEKIHLSYLVGGSGGAGVTVMRTTFLGLQSSFPAWIDRQWQMITPYSDREVLEFPQPYGRSGVYWFDMPETFTLAQAFPTVHTVITKFGSIPDGYNHLTWAMARLPWLLQSSFAIEFLSQVSYQMTQLSDRFSGIGVAIRSEVTGQKDNQSARSISILVHENTAIAAGCGTGSVAQLLISGWQKPGVWTVEGAIESDRFEELMAQRQIQVRSTFNHDP